MEVSVLVIFNIISFDFSVTFPCTVMFSTANGLEQDSEITWSTWGLTSQCRHACGQPFRDIRTVCVSANRSHPNQTNVTYILCYIQTNTATYSFC